MTDTKDSSYHALVRECHELGHATPTTFAAYTRNHRVDTPQCNIIEIFASDANPWGQTELVDISNYRVIESDPQLGVMGVNGIYQVEYIGESRLIAIAEELTPETRELVEAMSDYPIANEHVYSELELETHERNWDDYGRVDLIDNLDNAGWDVSGLDARWDDVDRAWSDVSELLNLTPELEYCDTVWRGMGDKATTDAVAGELGLKRSED